MIFANPPYEAMNREARIDFHRWMSNRRATSVLLAGEHADTAERLAWTPDKRYHRRVAYD